MAKRTQQTAAEIEAKAEASEAAAMIGIVPTGSPREPVAAGYHRIDVGRVAFDGNNHRSSTSVGKDSIEAFAKGLESTGLLHPIGVVDDPAHNRFILAYGERRFRAAMMLRWTEIDAKVYPAGTPIEAVRASENIDRTNLTPIEEALATGRVIQECGEDVELAANRLGKDPKWVRDRQFILRLSGDARKLVQDGYLPLHYAREIAKVADPKRRDELAESAVGSWALKEQTPGVGLERFERVRQWVNESMYSLAVVPWQTEVAFGGGPACSSCPSNTANDPKLFEADPDNSPDKAHCTNQGCFQRKQRAAEAAVNAGLDRLKKKADACEKDNVELTVTASSLANLAPKGIKESTFVRKAQQVVAPKDAEDTDKRESKPRQTPQEKARQEFDQAVGEWTRKGNERLVNELKKEPEKLAALALCDVHEAFDKLANSYGEANQRKALANPAWRKLLTEAGKAKGPFLKLAGAGLLNHWFDCIHQVCTQHPDVLVEVAKAFEVEMPPMPRIEEYMPKVDMPKAAAKVHAKAKGKAKASTNAKPVKSAKKPAGKKMKKAASKKPAKRKAGA